jgi:hypothetical protein
MRALKIELNRISVIDIDGADVHAELLALQHEVGGYIETVPLHDGAVMIVDEDGLLKQYSHNGIASLISKRHIFGTALIVGTDGDDFEDVPEQYLEWLRV